MLLDCCFLLRVVCCISCGVACCGLIWGGLIVVFVCVLFYDLPMWVIGVVRLVGYFWFVILRLALLPIRFVAFLRV